MLRMKFPFLDTVTTILTFLSMINDNNLNKVGQATSAIWLVLPSQAFIHIYIVTFSMCITGQHM